jgi:hypothetical protein
MSVNRETVLRDRALRGGLILRKHGPSPDIIGDRYTLLDPDFDVIPFCCVSMTLDDVEDYFDECDYEFSDDTEEVFSDDD